MRQIVGILVAGFTALCVASGALASELAAQFGWNDHPSFAGFYIAEDNGYFADEGLKVRFVPGGGMSRAVLKFALQALLVDEAMRQRPAVQGRG